MDRLPVFWQRLLVPEQWSTWVAAVPSAGGQHIAAAQSRAVCGGCNRGELLRQVAGSCVQSAVLQSPGPQGHLGAHGACQARPLSWCRNNMHGGYVEVTLKATRLLCCT